MTGDGTTSGWFKIEDAGERLWRQVHPSWVRDGRPSSQTFRPTPKDAGRLSCARSVKVDAAVAFRRHVHRGLKSAGVLYVTVGEAAQQQVDAYDDSADPDRPEEHAHLDFTAFSSGAQKAVAAVLVNLAREHGWAYEPAEPPSNMQ